MLSRIWSALRRRDRRRFDSFRFETNLDFHAEPLESRQMLAGNVTATVTGAGDLIIRGDNLSNHIHIETQGTRLRIEGKDGTTVNGADVTLIGGLTDDIQINMRNGNNTVQMLDITVPGDLIIRTGSGDDNVVAINVATGNDFEVFTKSGDDMVALGTPNVDEDLIINTSSGNDQVVWGSGDVFADAVFNLGSGNDLLVLTEDLDVHQELDIRAGGGNDFVGLGPDDVNLHGVAEIGMGGGDDTLVFDEPNFFATSGRFRGNGGRGDEFFIHPRVVLPAPTQQFEASFIVNNTDDIILVPTLNFIAELQSRVGTLIA